MYKLSRNELSRIKLDTKLCMIRSLYIDLLIEAENNGFLNIVKDSIDEFNKSTSTLGV